MRPHDPAAQVFADRLRNPGGEPPRGGVAHVVEEIAAVSHHQLRIDPGRELRQFRRQHVARDLEGGKECREILGGEIPADLLLPAGGEVERELPRGHCVFIAIGQLDAAPHLGRRLREIAGIEKQFQRLPEFADVGTDPTDRRLCVRRGGGRVEPQIVELDRSGFRLLADGVDHDSLEPQRVSFRRGRHLEIDLLPAFEIELHPRGREVAAKRKDLAAVGLRLQRALAEADLKIVAGFVSLDPDLRRSTAGKLPAVVTEVDADGGVRRRERIVQPQARQADLGIGGVRFRPQAGVARHERRKVFNELVRLRRRRRRQRDEEHERTNHDGGEVHLGASAAGEGDSGTQTTTRFSVFMYVRGGVM